MLELVKWLVRVHVIEITIINGGDRSIKSDPSEPETNLGPNLIGNTYIAINIDEPAQFGYKMIRLASLSQCEFFSSPIAGVAGTKGSLARAGSPILDRLLLCVAAAITCLALAANQVNSRPRIQPASARETSRRRPKVATLATESDTPEQTTASAAASSTGHCGKLASQPGGR